MKKLIGILLSMLLLCSLLQIEAFAEVNRKQEVLVEDCHSMSEKWFAGTQKIAPKIRAFENNESIVNVLETYFNTRERLVSNCQLSVQNNSASSVSSTVQTQLFQRSDGIAAFQEKANLIITDAEVTVLYDTEHIEYHEDGTITLYAYEWTFFDYDDLVDDVCSTDVSGFGVYHKIVLSSNQNGREIVTDEYDESEISGICTINDSTRKELEEMDWKPIDTDAEIVRDLESLSQEEKTGVGDSVNSNYYTWYSPYSCAAYADQYVYNGAQGGGIYEYYYNSAYANFNGLGGDCANYTSQSIYAGGMPQVVGAQYGTDGWFYITSTNRSATWTNAAQLRNWMAANRGSWVNASNSTVFTGSPVFYNDEHATICVGKNSAGTPIVNSHNNDWYHVKWNYWGSGTTYTTVQLTPSDSYIDPTPDPGPDPDPTPSNQCGSDLYWSFNAGTGVLSITGSGRMWDYYWWNDDVPWISYRDSITKVLLPEGLTSIGAEAFHNCSSLKSVSIPNSVTSIGYAAFEFCTSLTRVAIPANVTSIDTDAFSCCTSLTSVSIQNGLTSIGASSFYQCTSLTDVTIPDSVTSICRDAFYGCDALTNVTIPDSVTSIGGYAFYGCDALTSVILPNHMTSIGEYAFAYCDALTNVTISSNPTNIDNSLFNQGADAADDITQDDETGIGKYAFYDCELLESVTIPDGLTSIGKKAFSDCESLTGVEIPNSVTSIGDYAFEYCNSLADVSIPDSVLSIGENAFKRCSSLVSMTLPDGLISIGVKAFENCWRLNSVWIPQSVMSIGDRSFYECSGLDSITILNPECDIYHDRNTLGIPDKTVIYGIGDSTAQQYAEWYDYSFCEIEASHSYVQDATPPSCTEQGYTTYICTFCGDSYVDDFVPALGHDYAESVTPPTCTEQGSTTYTCTRCEDSYVSEGIPALGHDYAESVTPPTCTEQGSTTYTCTRCADSYEGDSIPALGHYYVQIVTVPTCIEQGRTTFSCARCDDSYVGDSIPALGHDYSEQNVTPATCAEQGYTTYTCTRCGDSYMDHYTDALGHDWGKWTILQVPTAIENGVEQRVCVRCGEIEQREILAGSGVIRLSSERARPGDEVTVSVNMVDNPGIMVIRLKPEYNTERLQLIGYEDVGLTGWYVNEYAIWIGDGESTATGEVLRLKFKVLDNAEEGDAFVTLSYEEGDIANYNEDIVSFAIESGKVTVFTVLPGDITGDGNVNALDLLRLKKYFAGDNVVLVGSADITGDGLVNALDLLRLKKYLAGDNVVIH